MNGEKNVKICTYGKKPLLSSSLFVSDLSLIMSRVIYIVESPLYADKGVTYFSSPVTLSVSSFEITRIYSLSSCEADSISHVA